MWVEKHCAGCGKVIEKVHDPAASRSKMMATCDDCNAALFKSNPPKEASAPEEKVVPKVSRRRG